LGDHHIEVMVDYLGTGYTPQNGGMRSFTGNFVPEPASATLLAIGALGLFGLA
jgi:hypothetical protein